MSHERLHSQSSRSYASHDDDLDVAPGRDSQSSHLSAPTNPIESGLLDGKLYGQVHDDATATTTAKARASGAGPRSKGGLPAIEVVPVHPAPKGPRERTTIAVGEEVTLIGSVPGNWTTTGGTPGARTASTLAWTAPPTPGPVTVMFVANKQTVHQTLEVIAPDSIRMTNFGDPSIDPGKAGVPMYAHVTIGPDSVNFGKIEIRERSGDPSAVIGYFERRSPDENRHHAKPKFARVGTSNVVLGYDKIGTGGLPRPYSHGVLIWQIPTLYRVVGTTGDGAVFTTTTQVFTMSDESGAMAVSKAGATASRTPFSKYAATVP